MCIYLNRRTADLQGDSLKDIARALFKTDERGEFNFVEHVMKRILTCAGLIAFLALPFSAKAQDNPPEPQPTVQNPPKNPHTFNHAEVGVYGDLFRVPGHNGGSDVNFLGLGGRIGFNMHPNVALEAEMNYDFEKNYTTVTTSGGTTTTVTTGVRPLTGLFGPKFQFGTSGPFRAFLTGKAGFIEFSRSGMPASGTTFSSSFDQFGNGNTYFAAYPGGGIEAFIGPVGIRAEAGDELYLNNGTHNQLRVTFGPTIRF